jgi:hypothetical protein
MPTRAITTTTMPMIAEVEMPFDVEGAFVVVSPAAFGVELGEDVLWEAPGTEAAEAGAEVCPVELAP